MMRRLVIGTVLAAMALALAGCNTMAPAPRAYAPGGPVVAAAPPPGSATVGGAAVGAGIGALASKHHAKGALIGAGVGALTGAALEAGAAQRQADYEAGYREAQSNPPAKTY